MIRIFFRRSRGDYVHRVHLRIGREGLSIKKKVSSTASRASQGGMAMRPGKKRSVKRYMKKNYTSPSLVTRVDGVK